MVCLCIEPRGCNFGSLIIRTCRNSNISHTEMTRLWQGCRILATLSQACDKLVTTLSPPHHSHAIISQAHCNLVTTMSCLSHDCHNMVIFSPPHRNLVTTLQACDQVIHAHLMIFILTKTQKMSIEVHST